MRSITSFLLILLSSWGLAAEPKKVQSSISAVTDLHFNELLNTPVGPQGFSLSERAKSLNGKPIRITGYMVKEENTFTNRFLLTPIFVQLHDDHYGLADDLPITTLFVSTHNFKGPTIRYTPGPIVISGVLSIGNREEPDGRVSTFQLALNAPLQRPGQEKMKSKVTKPASKNTKNLKHITPPQTKNK